MIHKIKALSLAFVAIAALSVVAASAAQASSKLDIGATPAVLTGVSESEHILTLTHGTEKFPTKCPSASFEGTTEGQPLEDVTVTPTYGKQQVKPTGCVAFGVQAQVLMNGCKYTLTGAGQAAHTALVDIVGCTTGKQIEIITSICTLDVPQQNGLSHVVGKNLGPLPETSNKEVTLEATVVNVGVKQTGAACPGGNNNETDTAEFTGNTIVKAFKDKEEKLVTKHGHQYNEHICGEQVTLIST